jgi:DNA polymerase V
VELRQTIKQWAKTPVSIGVAPTKALAKCANKFAKKMTKEGVYLCSSEQSRKSLLEWTEIGDVWGIGRQYAKLLSGMGIKNAYQFTMLPEAWVRKQMSVVGRRLYLELNGISCLSLDDVQPKQNMCVSRSFSGLITAKEDLKKVLATHIATLCAKLRRQKQCATAFQIFIITNRFREQDKQYYGSLTTTLPKASNDTILLTRIGSALLDKAYKPGLNYKKAGVMALGLVPENPLQGCLFESEEKGKNKDLMQSMDAINKRYGCTIVRTAAQGFDNTAEMLRQYISPCYTTNIRDIPHVKN